MVEEPSEILLPSALSSCEIRMSIETPLPGLFDCPVCVAVVPGGAVMLTLMIGVADPPELPWWLPLDASELISAPFETMLPGIDGVNSSGPFSPTR